VKTVLLFSLLAPLAFAEPYKAQYFDLENPKILVFNIERKEVLKDKELESTVIYTNPDGTPALEEHMWTADDVITKYRLKQHQFNEEGGLDVVKADDSTQLVKYFYVNSDGKRSEDNEKMVSNLVVSGTTIVYLKSQWDTLLSGKPVEVKFVVIDRTESFTFKFKKIGDHEVNGKQLMEVELTPSSIFVAAVVKPMLFVFEKDTARIVETRGQIMPKRNVDGRWKDAYVRGVYDYPNIPSISTLEVITPKIPKIKKTLRRAK